MALVISTCTEADTIGVVNTMRALQARSNKNHHVNDELVDMVSRENKVIAGFIALAVILLFGIHSVLEPPTWVSGAVVIGVGVVVPTLVNEYLTRKEQS